MKSKKRHIKRGIAPSAKKQDVFYKPFVRCCIILLAGILIPQYFQIYYLEYTFLYMVVIPICILSGLYFKFIKKLPKGPLYISLWAAFCTTFTLYTTVNLVYTSTQPSHFFTSEIEKAVSAGFRSPACLFLKLNNKEVALIVNNENPVKEKIETRKHSNDCGYVSKRIVIVCKDTRIHNQLTASGFRKNTKHAQISNTLSFNKLRTFNHIL